MVKYKRINTRTIRGARLSKVLIFRLDACFIPARNVFICKKCEKLTDPHGIKERVEKWKENTNTS